MGEGVANTWFDQRTTFDSLEAAVEALREWVEQTDEDTVGAAEYGQEAWIGFDSAHGRVKINSDTRREAVERMLRAHENGASWRVDENADGVVNKVIFDEDRATQQGWYAYLLEPLAAPSSL